MVYSSWNIRCDRQKFFVILGHFCPFSPLTTQKIKFLNWKKHLEILSFYTFAPHMAIIWCMAPEIWSAIDRIFRHSGPLFALLPPYGSRKSKFWKHEKNSRRYYHFTNVHHKWQSMMYGSWDMECNRHNFLSFWTIFCPFTPP